MSELENVKLSSDGPSDDKFLFFFKPENVEKECVGGISLVNGIKIFAGVSLLQALSTLMEVFQAELFLEKVGYIILTCLFAIICFCAFFAAFNDNILLAKISYWIAAVLFLISGIKFICKSVMKTIEFINPFDGDFLDIKFLTYIFGRGLYLFIYLYFIWILYCFMANHDKNN